LPNYTFTIDILELARLLNLQYPSNAIYYAGQGMRFYVFNTGSGYNAFEAACPIQKL
jgi:hypothetical protein